MKRSSDDEIGWTAAVNLWALTTPSMTVFPISVHACDQKRLPKTMLHIARVILV